MTRPVKRTKPARASGFAESDSRFEVAHQESGPGSGGEARRLKIGPGGRVVIPADFRKAMEVGEGEIVTAIVENGELRLVGLKVALRRAQAYVGSIVPEDTSLADELIADRRREVEEEHLDG